MKPVARTGTGVLCTRTASPTGILFLSVYQYSGVPITRTCSQYKYGKLVEQVKVPGYQVYYETKSNMKVCWNLESKLFAGSPIESMYDTLVNKQAVFDKTTIIDQIKYPLENTAYLKDGVSSVCEISIGDGGRYMTNNKMTTQQKINLTMLLTDLTTIPKVDPSTDEKCYQVIPPIIQKFAEGSRPKKKYNFANDHIDMQSKIKQWISEIVKVK
jgi:hypothetical protein